MLDEGAELEDTTMLELFETELFETIALDTLKTLDDNTEPAASLGLLDVVAPTEELGLDDAAWMIAELDVILVEEPVVPPPPPPLPQALSNAINVM